MVRGCKIVNFPTKLLDLTVSEVKGLETGFATNNKT